MAYRLETHVDGLGFPEGPVALPDGSVAFVDLLHRKIRAYKDGETLELADVQGAPNGMRLGPDGSLYICNNGGLAPAGIGILQRSDPEIDGCIMRLLPDGKVETWTSGLPGPSPWRPNDLVFSPQNEVVFTDPQNWEDDGEAYRGGQLLLADHKGSVRRLRDMSGFPNGLCFHPDGSLIVGITLEHRFLQFEWKDGAPLDAPREWLRLDDGFNPDGMIVHRDRIFAAGSVGDRIAVLSTDGTLLDEIHCGDGSDPTNVCVHAGKLWITLGYGGALVSVDLDMWT